MKFNPRLKADVEKYKEYVIIVEGKKDVNALKSLGFGKVYAVHQTAIPIKEKVEQISEKITKKDKVCILTDLNKKGKKLYMLLKSMFQEQGVRLDSTLRMILIKSGISHIELLNKFIKKLEYIN